MDRDISTISATTHHTWQEIKAEIEKISEEKGGIFLHTALGYWIEDNGLDYADYSDVTDYAKMLDAFGEDALIVIDPENSPL